jgi:hypothetical protein
MEQASMAETNMAMDSTIGGYEGDGLYIKTYNQEVQNMAKSKEEGRPIFEMIPHMSIRAPGAKDTFVTVVTEIEKKKYHKHWKAFIERQEEVLVEGTLLEKWPAITRAEAEELKFFKIFTVEQLAGMSDTNAQNFRGMNNRRAKAKAYLSASSVQAKAEEITDLQEELKELKEQLLVLTEAPVAAAPSEDIAALIAQGIEQAMAGMAPAPKAKRKRRSSAEMAAARADEEKAKTE